MRLPMGGTFWVVTGLENTEIDTKELSIQKVWVVPLDKELLSQKCPQCPC